VRLEGLGQLKNLMISLGMEPATFRLVAWRRIVGCCFRIVTRASPYTDGIEPYWSGAIARDSVGIYSIIYNKKYLNIKIRDLRIMFSFCELRAKHLHSNNI
jgi:hypothetical protein